MPRALAPSPAPEPIRRLLDAAAFRRLYTEQPRALGEARQQARFLCGLSSPALSPARLVSHPLFGVLCAHRFGEVLAYLRAETEVMNTTA
jgi:ATP-dependent DNA helicase RecQ